MLKIFTDGDMVSVGDIVAKYPGYRFLMTHIRADGNELYGVLKAVSDSMKELTAYRDGLSDAELGMFYLGGEPDIPRVGPYLFAEEENIVRKIHKEDSALYAMEDSYEQDNGPDPFRDLSLEEMEYLQAHPGLLKEVFPEAFSDAGE